MPIDHHHAPFDTAWRTEAVLIRRRLIRLQDETRSLRHALARKYNPDQPRLPAGNPYGGRWTSGGGGGGAGAGSFADFGATLGLAEYGGAAEPWGGSVASNDPTESDPWSSFDEAYHDNGSLASSNAKLRNGTSISSEYTKLGENSEWDERHTVTLPDGETITFETAGRTQTIRDGGPTGEILGRVRWSAEEPEQEETVQLARHNESPRRKLARRTMETGLALLTWLSSRGGKPGEKAIASFKAMDFQRSDGIPSLNGIPSLYYVGRISEDEAKIICPRLPEVQRRLNDAVAIAGDPKLYKNAGAYGSAVHTSVARPINQMRNPRFFAERSFVKEEIELDITDWARYGQSETKRADIIENVDDRTICSYDLKTGKAEINVRRAVELLGGMKRHFPHASRFIMMQIKPQL